MPSLSLGQTQRQAQTQTLSAVQRHRLEMLQKPLAALSADLRQAADLNPALVVEDPGAVSLDAARDEFDRGREPESAEPGEADADFGVLGELGSEADEFYADGGNNEYDPDAEERRQFFFDSIPATESLQEHLLAQLDECALPPADRALAEQIVGSVDDDGRLAAPLAEIAQSSFRSLEDAERTLRLVQGFSPTGVAARDLRECLLLQLLADPGTEGSVARRLASDPDAFALLATRDFARAAARLGVSAGDVRDAVRTLSSLDPAPGRAYGSAAPDWVRVEIVVRETEDGVFEAFLDEDALPRVRVSESWTRRYERARKALAGRAGDRSAAARGQREARDWIRDRIREAEELADGLAQRKATMLAVARRVVARQQAFFRDGPAALAPLTMAQVADDLGIDESTVSRAVAGKYLRSPRGVAELRSFFRAGIKTAAGDTIAADRVQARLRELVAAEDPARPLSDRELAGRLAAEGLPIARRTVVKYRGLLDIPSAAERKR